MNYSLYNKQIAMISQVDSQLKRYSQLPIRNYWNFAIKIND